MSSHAIIAEHVRKSYATRAAPLVILRDASLTLERGRSAAIVGPSGAGKSTFLNILGALDAADDGRVLVDDVDAASLDGDALARFRGTHVGFVFQSHHLFPQCTALENVILPSLARRGGPDRAARAAALLERVGLAARRAHYPAELSGGERQRVAIARALINEPAVVLADEPTGNLDRVTADEIGAALHEATRGAGAALLIVTHSERLAESCDARYELVDGTLRALA